MNNISETVNLMVTAKIFKVGKLKTQMNIAVLYPTNVQVFEQVLIRGW